MSISGSPISSYIPGRPPITDVASDSSFDMINSWIHECDENHPPMCHPANAPLPRRVIVVTELNDAGDVRLFAPTSPIFERYIALSYCWGSSEDDRQIMTTQATLHQHLIRFSFQSLPKTIQDAITVTRRLSIKYLWVDALCIIQDSAIDKQEQIHIMGDIYANAYLTISATSATGCGQGFLEPRRNDTFAVPYRGPDGRISNVFFSRVIRTYEREQIEEPLNQRAWTLQETMLSKRVVFFGSIQPYWKCPFASKAGGDPDASHYFVLTDLKPLLNVYQTTPSVADWSEMFSGAYQDWHSLVEDYSRRLLTIKKDKAAAISGLAKKYYTEDDGTYLAGIRESHVHVDLLWSRGKEHAKPKVTAQLQALFESQTAMRFPTWSWMSFDGSVKYHLQRMERVVKACDIVIETGEGTDPALKISGKLRNVLIPKHNKMKGRQEGNKCYVDTCWDSEKGWKRGGILNGKGPESVGVVYFDDPHILPTSDKIGESYWWEDFESAPEVWTCLLIAGIEPPKPLAVMKEDKKIQHPLDYESHGLVIQATAPSSNVYRRVGLLNGDTGWTSHQSSNLYFGKQPKVNITLI
jgi:hypothetical protein